MTTRPQPRRRDRIPGILLLLTVCERLAFVFGSIDRTWPFSIFYEGDSEAFFNYAQAILKGLPYDNGIPFHPPLFPLVLSGLHALLGDPVAHGILRAVLAVASAAVPVMLYLLLRSLIGRAAALAAGLLATFSFGLDVLGSAATSETLFLLILLGMLLITREGFVEGRPGMLRALLLGALGGALALTRAEGILLAFAIPVVWVGKSILRTPSRSVPTLIAVLIGLALVLTPWTVRNSLSLEKWNRETGSRIGTELPTFVPLTSYGPLNFALANNDYATGGFQRDLLTSKSDIAVLDLSDSEHRHYFLNGTGEGWTWITQNPAAYASLAVRKLDINLRSLDLGWSPWNLPHGRAGTRRPVDLFAPETSGLRWVQLLIAAAGLVILLRMRETKRGALLIGLPILAALPVTLLFFGYVRLGMITAPFIYAFEGVALAALASKLPGRLRQLFARRLTTSILVALAIAVLVYAGTQERNYIASGKTDRPGGKLSRDAPMQISPARE